MKKKRKKYLQKRDWKKRKRKRLQWRQIRRKTSSAPQLHSIERKKGLEREKKENKVIRVKMEISTKEKRKRGGSEDLGGRGKGKCQDWWDLHRKTTKQ